MDLYLVADLEVGEPGHGVLVAELHAPARRGVLATFVEGDAAVGEEHRVRHLHEVLAAGVLLGLPLHVEGADRGRVVLVAGHDVHRAAGDVAVVEQPGPALGDVDARLGGRRARRARDERHLRAGGRRAGGRRGLRRWRAPSWPIRRSRPRARVPPRVRRRERARATAAGTAAGAGRAAGRSAASAVLAPGSGPAGPPVPPSAAAPTTTSAVATTAPSTAARARPSFPRRARDRT